MSPLIYCLTGVCLLANVGMSQNYTNEYEAAIEIDIRIKEHNTDISGFTNLGKSFFDHVLAAFKQNDQSVKDVLKICIIVGTFETESDTSDEVKYVSRLYEEIVDDVKNKMSAVAQQDRSFAAFRNKSLKGRRREVVTDTFKMHLRDGKPEVPILVRRVESDGTGVWYKNIEKLIKRLKAAKETHGMLIVANHFGIAPGRGLRMVLYDLKDTSAPLWNATVNSQNRNFGGKTSEEALKRAWSAIQDQLRRCQYTLRFEEGQCYYYYLRGKCRKQMKRTPVIVSGADPKYCLRGYRYFGFDCDNSICDRRCKLYEKWTRCNASCDGYRQLRRIRATNDSNVHIVNCPMNSNLPVQKCNVGDCRWSAILVIIGIILLVLVLASFVVYLFLWNRSGKSRKQKKSSEPGWMSEPDYISRYFLGERPEAPEWRATKSVRESSERSAPRAKSPESQRRESERPTTLESQKSIRSGKSLRPIRPGSPMSAVSATIRSESKALAASPSTESKGKAAMV